MSRDKRLEAKKVRERQKKHHDAKKERPDKREIRIISLFRPEPGEVVVGVVQGNLTRTNEVMYRIPQEELVGACENRAQLAGIVNNLGLLALAQLTGFNLAESLDQLPKSLAKWGHFDLDELKRDARTDAEREAEALRIAQERLHGTHGRGTEADGPEDSGCQCKGTADQVICATVGCGFCIAQGIFDERGAIREEEQMEVAREIMTKHEGAFEKIGPE